MPIMLFTTSSVLHSHSEIYYYIYIYGKRIDRDFPNTFSFFNYYYYLN